MDRSRSFAAAQEIVAALAGVQSREALWHACAEQARRLFGAPRFFVGLVSLDAQVLHLAYLVEPDGRPGVGAVPVPVDLIRSVLTGEVAATAVRARPARGGPASGTAGEREQASLLPWLVAALRGADRLYGVVAVQWPGTGAVGPEQLGGIQLLARQTGLMLDRIERERLWQTALRQTAEERSDGLAVADDAGYVQLTTPGFWRVLDLTPPADGAVGWETARLVDLVAGRFVERSIVRTLLLLPKERHREHLDFHQDGRAIALSVLLTGTGDYGVGRVLILHDRSSEAAAPRAGEEILSVLSHELRTPLTSIKGYAQLLRGLAPHRPEVEERALEVIDAQTEHLLKLIEGLFTVADIDRGRLVLRRAPADVGDLIREVVQAMRRLSPIHRLRLVAEPLPLALVDPERIQEVVRHLVENAVKYSPAGGEVVVTVRARADEIVVEVRDSGVGVSPELRDRIFDRFYQADPSSARRFGGAGLGLYLCRGIVQAHGGRIWVESEPDRGSTFGFAIPIARPSREDAAT